MKVRELPGLPPDWVKRQNRIVLFQYVDCILYMVQLVWGAVCLATEHWFLAGVGFASAASIAYALGHFHKNVMKNYKRAYAIGAMDGHEDGHACERTGSYPAQGVH